MTEAEWRTCADIGAMLEFIDGKTSARKLRLFACACCRSLGDLLTDERSRQALRIAERFAEGQSSAQELADAHEAALNATYTLPSGPPRLAGHAAHAATAEVAVDAASIAAIFAAAAQPALSDTDLLGEIIGNPFAVPTERGSWPAIVITLAQALERGEDCHFALHDALLEAGHSELAEHFRTPNHPRGCWGVDFLLGKE
jgi:hypothetical protein